MDGMDQISPIIQEHPALADPKELFLAATPVAFTKLSAQNTSPFFRLTMRHDTPGLLSDSKSVTILPQTNARRFSIGMEPGSELVKEVIA
jgi:hypothetical protein